MTVVPSHADRWPLDRLPPEWLQALLPIGSDKRPYDPATGRRTGWTEWLAFDPEALLQAPAVGLRLGPISGGTLAIDFDGEGEEAESDFFKTFSNPSARLPRSIAWKSGKPGRRQIAFKVPESRWAELDQRRAKIGALEIRWAGQQSVILGAHPETDGYRWVEGCAPWETPLAEAPAWLWDLMPRKAASPPPLLQALEAPQPVSGGLVPFREFLSKRAADLIDSGSRAGSCNDDGLWLSLELVGTYGWLQHQGAKPDESARDAYACYLSHCDDTINGEPFDTRTAWARFDGAAAQQPTPSTPEAKLLERLSFHRRKGTSGRVVVPVRRHRKLSQRRHEN